MNKEAREPFAKPPLDSAEFPRRARMMTLEEVAERMNLSMRTIYRRVKDRTIPALKLGSVWRCNPQHIDELCGTLTVPCHTMATEESHATKAPAPTRIH
jgi:excisionase family DNA binding protein